jgi:hypothetical protein
MSGSKENLLEATKEAIEKSGHTPEDIDFIGSEDRKYVCSWEKFQEIANYEYDYSWGSAKVAKDLIIVFDDGEYMVREEYDGAENWRYLEEYEEPDEQVEIERVIGDHWPSLKDLNDEDVRDHHLNENIEEE